MTTPVIPIGTAVKEMGWIPCPHRFTATLATADTRGETRTIAEAKATRGPPSRERSSEKITAAPAKPRRIPPAAFGVSRSEGRAKWARTATKRG